ncbi:MAG: NADH-quinone oxidoreductase subunit NuoH [Thermoleophilia bacterium]|nr:NADH-quinone oxidoreductase subunit NuoH [Thermoleophilia bacterium]
MSLAAIVTPLSGAPLAEVGFKEPLVAQIVIPLLVFAVMLQLVPVVLLIERKLMGRLQGRYGPNRVGPFGALQPLVDIVKLASKEDFAPRTAAKSIFIIAPAIAIFTAIVTIAIIPFGDTRTNALFGADYGLYGVDVSIGILYAFAFGAIAFYGLMLGGWASGSKYSFLGAMRSAAQLISYELAAGLSLVGVVMMTGSLSLTAIVREQSGLWFVVPQFVGFLIFTVASFAETNRAPFDLVEADAELVAGYQTEYGGMRFASFMMAEYMNMITFSGIATAMFLGGWHGPGPGWLDPIWVVTKMFGFLLMFIWIRATLPRLRYDRLMKFGWKILLPIATLNLVATAAWVALS